MHFAFVIFDLQLENKVSDVEQINRSEGMKKEKNFRIMQKVSEANHQK